METDVPKINAKIYNRESLYQYFKNGSLPTEKHFHDLINSTINRLDDGISKDFSNGLQLAPQASDEQKGENLISFYEQLDGSDSLWTIGLMGTASDKMLNIKSEQDQKNILSLSHGGKIGINKSHPKYTLDVNGAVGMHSRVGTFKKGTIKANSQWQPILKGLEGCNQFEVTAIAHGKEGEGKYASIYAIASNAYSGKNGRIRYTRDYYGWKWWKRIGLRWVGNPFDYDLEIRTFSDYGDFGEIEFSITKLGEDLSYK
jgi:hypothetical protein